MSLLLALIASSHAADRVAVVVSVEVVGGVTTDGAAAVGAAAAAANGAVQVRSLADILASEGGYEVVHTLAGTDATLAHTRELLLQTVPGELDPGGTLLVFWQGHAIGGDFGDPYLLLSDSQADDLAGTSLHLESFAPELAGALSGSNLVVLTDLVRTGMVGGQRLDGPTAKSWPPLGGTVFVLSAGSAGEASEPGQFAEWVVEARSADLDADGRLTASELHRAVLDLSTGSDLHPQEAGSYPPDLYVIAAAVPGQLSAGASKRRFGGPVSAALVGGAAVGGGFGLLRYFQGRSLCDQTADELRCPTTGEFRSLRTQSIVGYTAGSVLFAAGVGFAFVPLDNGWMIGFQSRM